MSGFKLPSFSNNTTGGSAGTVAGSAATSAAVDRMGEINRRNEETRKALELEYARFRKELSAAYEARTQVDYENFDRISEINFGIFKATEEITNLDPRVLIANLKSQENMARLMPVSEAKKQEIVTDIEIDRKTCNEDKKIKKCLRIRKIKIKRSSYFHWKLSYKHQFKYESQHNRFLH
jgi:hypothetical protein